MGADESLELTEFEVGLPGLLASNGHPIRCF